MTSRPARITVDRGLYLMALRCAIEWQDSLVAAQEGIPQQPDIDLLARFRRAYRQAGGRPTALEAAADDAPAVPLHQIRPSDHLVYPGMTADDAPQCSRTSGHWDDGPAACVTCSVSTSRRCYGCEQPVCTDCGAHPHDGPGAAP